MEPSDKFFTLVTQVLAKLYKTGNISITEIINKHNQIFNRTSTLSENEGLINYFVSMTGGNSVLVYRPRDRYFYYRPHKL